MKKYGRGTKKRLFNKIKHLGKLAAAKSNEAGLK
jgi:hypothetical protein